jgi:hypothetical protein
MKKLKPFCLQSKWYEYILAGPLMQIQIVVSMIVTIIIDTLGSSPQ